MEERTIRVRRRHPVLLTILILLILSFAAGSAWYVLFRYNTFSLYLEVYGEPEMKVEYGDAYQEPGSEAVLRGSVFWQDGFPMEIPVEIRGSVNDRKTGKYELEYYAQLHGLEASGRRTIRVIDTVCPEITLIPDPPDLEAQPVYDEAGFSAFDNYDGDITDRVIRTAEEGRIIYAVLDSSGNPAYAFRDIPIYDITPPEIILNGGENYTIYVGMHYSEPGYEATDNHDGDLTGQVMVEMEEEIPWDIPGNYEITYHVADSKENETTVVRHVHVVPKERPQVQYPDGKTIYLTFDDGPCPDTVRLLNILAKYNVKATFFVVNTGYPEILKRIHEEGHSIAIHTMSHNYQAIYADEEAFFADLKGMQNVIRQATGEETWLMRFPGGSSNLVSRKNKGIMTRLTRIVQDAGFVYFDWNVDSNDAGGAQKASEVFANVKEGVQNHPYSVVLQHDIHPFSVDAVERIIQWGLENGYTFLPLEMNSPSAHHSVLN